MKKYLRQKLRQFFALFSYTPALQTFWWLILFVDLCLEGAIAVNWQHDTVLYL